MAKNNEPFGQLNLLMTGWHIGDGWIEIETAHPIVQMYFRNGLVNLPVLKTKDVPEGVKVSVLFERTKKTLKVVNWTLTAGPN